ncbi:MAG: LPS export ABC transporter periplasmic protein LptC [Chitinophagaceae bacterium]
MFARKPINIILVFFAVCIWLCSCENDLKELPDDGKAKRSALDEGHDIQIYMSQGGKVKGKLSAPLMYIYQSVNPGDSSYTEFPKTLHIDFYNDSLQKESQLDALYAKDRSWENRVFLKGNVVVINVIKGDTLRCEELWWDKNKQKFYTDKPARYSQHDHFVNYGRNGLEAKQDLSDLTFYDNSGTLPVPKEDTLAHTHDTLVNSKVQ